jgi:hypothetical protein
MECQYKTKTEKTRNNEKKEEKTTMSLPWQGIRVQNKRARYEKIKDKKIETSIETVL